MTYPRSANEIEALVFKAARGGGLPLGLAEDLAQATAFLDLDRLSACPCQPGGGAFEIPIAIDAVLAGKDAPRLAASQDLIAAYCAATSQHGGETIGCRVDADGVVIERTDAQAASPLGRRLIPAPLAAHLDDMAAKTLVPESAASRQSGAGAGLTDND